MNVDLGYSFCGFVIGTLIDLTGMGGGSLMTPLLILLFGVHPVSAVGTDLMYAAATKTVGTAVHARLGHVDWRIVGRLALGSVPMTALTIYGLSLAPRQSAVMDSIIAVVIGITLIAAAASVAMRHRLRAFAEERARLHGATRHLFLLTVLLGATLGVLVTLSSVGAGALGVAILALLYPNMPAARVVGSDIAHAVTLTLLAGTGHWLIGSVDWHIVGVLLVGSLPGIWLGSLITARVSEVVLFPVLASLLAFIGVRMLVG